MTRWFRRVVWFIAITGWLIVILAGLLTTATPGQIVALLHICSADFHRNFPGVHVQMGYPAASQPASRSRAEGCGAVAASTHTTHPY